ncbi:hypothetical protein WMY93_033989 [Mugilogobius chulae]|uniref:Fucosyltransferase n=1 Tax=Mugilogobius chulae TaxID=88201 RepID=A0AAW0MGK9_9GOBI
MFKYGQVANSRTTIIGPVMSSSYFTTLLRNLAVVFTVALIFALLLVSYNAEKQQEISAISYLPQRAPFGNSSEVKTPEEKTPDTIVLIWMYPFNAKFSLSCDEFGFSGCMLTDDKALYSKAHGPRPSFQKWVWFNMESPSNSGKMAALDSVFNLTTSYRRDSDIFVPYGNLVPLSSDANLFTRVPAKDKLVCWIVSNWNSRFKRVQYYNELKKHVQIHTYGRAFGEYIDDKKYVEIMSSCKFYLSFENSVHQDYITEKFYSPMKLGAVPVVLGPPRENYEAHAPGDSFIHVDDFTSPKALADKLQHLHEHPDEYMSYFDWRNSFEVANMRFGHEHACRTCHHLRAQTRYQSETGNRYICKNALEPRTDLGAEQVAVRESRECAERILRESTFARGHSCLTRLSSHKMSILAAIHVNPRGLGNNEPQWNSPRKGLADRVVVSLFKKDWRTGWWSLCLRRTGRPGVCVPGTTLLSLSGKVYSSVAENPTNS